MSRVRRKQEYMAELIEKAQQKEADSKLISNAVEEIVCSKGLLKSIEEVQLYVRNRHEINLSRQQIGRVLREEMNMSYRIIKS